ASPLCEAALCFPASLPSMLPRRRRPGAKGNLRLPTPKSQVVATGAPDDELGRQDHPARLFLLVLRLDPGQEHLGAHVPKVIARLPHRREGYIGEPQKLDVVKAHK